MWCNTQEAASGHKSHSAATLIFHEMECSLPGGQYEHCETLMFGIPLCFLQSVPALAKAGPDCDPCGGPQNVTVQSKKEKD